MTPAPKSRRPLWRRPLVILAIIVLVPLVLVASQVFIALTAKPAPTVDSHRKLHELVLGGRAPTDDAWPTLDELDALLRQVREEVYAIPRDNRDKVFLTYEALYLSPEEMKAQGHLDQDPEVSDDVKLELFKTLAADGFERLVKRGVFDRTARLAHVGRAARPPGSGSVMDVLLPELGTMRELARIQRARAHMALARHNEQEAIRAIDETLGLCRLIGSQAFVIDRFAAATTMRNTLEFVRETAATRRLSAAACRSLSAVIDAQIKLPPAQHAVEGERISALDMVQWTHSGEGFGGGRRLLPEVTAIENGTVYLGSTHTVRSTPRIANLKALSLPRKAEIDARVNAYCDRVRAACDLPASEQQAAFRALDADVAKQIAADDYMKLVLTSMSLLPDRDLGLAVDRAGTRVLLEIDAYRAEHGRLPPSLDVLPPSIDPYCGKPFVYRIDDNAPGGYVLYSMGPDGVDNAATPPKSSVGTRAYPTPKPGEDFILWGAPTTTE